MLLMLAKLCGFLFAVFLAGLLAFAEHLAKPSKKTIEKIRRQREEENAQH